MSGSKLPPNELADLYEAFFTIRENLPDDVDPLWELAIESILFGGGGLAEGNRSYGEQQSDDNSFKITEYRSCYGDGERVTEFPAITTNDQTQTGTGEGIQLPVAPQSNQTVPLSPRSEELADAFSLLNEFPSTPGDSTGGTDESNLLKPSKFPGIASESNPIRPNELADLYDCFRILIEQLPDDYPEWETALRTVWQQTEYMTMASSYAQQTIQRNTFSMDEYREEYGDGERVTEFPAIQTYTIHESDFDHLSETIYLPYTPDTTETLPGSPVDSSLPEALSKLQEFPAWPEAERYNDEAEEHEGPLLDAASLLADSDLDLEPELTSEDDQSNGEVSSSPPSSPADDVSHQPDQGSDEVDVDRPEAASEKTVLRNEQVGEQRTAPNGIGNSSGSKSVKYEDPQAEEAHRRAQERDPSEVVELGEEISLVLKEADYSSRPATIRGTKNSLVIFVTDAPQDLSKHDSIRVKIVDYGGKNNSAEAVFVSYNG